MKVRFFVLFVCLILAGQIVAQRNVRDSSIFVVAVFGQAGVNQPYADLQKRFGTAGQVGGGALFKLKSNWNFQVDYNFIFGRTVNEDTILNSLLTEDGFIINRRGNIADVFLLQRGYTVMGSVGKLFPIIGPNPNSGLNLTLGAGFMEHKILIRNESELVPQVLDDYAKGYDRLSNGLALRQSLGYQHFSNYRLINFYLGIEFTEAFTQNRRSINFDTMKADNSTRFDVFGSVVFKWYFRIYKRKPQEYYFY